MNYNTFRNNSLSLKTNFFSNLLRTTLVLYDTLVLPFNMFIISC